MSDTPKMDYEQAQDVLLSSVFAQPFFAKLASDYNVVPANEDEANKLLAIAERLSYMDDAGVSKSANDRQAFLDHSLQKLDQALGTVGQQHISTEVKEAAAALAKDQVLRDAALLYQDNLIQSANA